jgi:hypothetical protein
MTTKPRSTARGLVGDVEAPAQRLRHAGGVALLRQPRTRERAAALRASVAPDSLSSVRRQHLVGERDCLVGPPLEHGELGEARLRLEHVAARNLVAEKPAATRRS